MIASLHYSSPHHTYQPWLHRIAWLTAIATFPLIFMGGLVTSHGAGMSVPDWPNSYGYNMFTFPISQWKGGILFEHTHRLMGSAVGFCSIALVIAAWKLERRMWARWTAYAVLSAVLFQGVLGGLRVVLVKLDLAIVHACFAQAFFCLAMFVVIITSRWWITEDTGRMPVPHQELHGHPIRGLNLLACTTCGLVYLQLIVGAIMRHNAAGLAIPDLPLAYGHWLPPISDAGLSAINQQRAWMYSLDPVSLSQIWLHFGHRIGAVVVSIAATTLIALILRRHRDQRQLFRSAMLLGVLLIAQITLGVLTVLLRKPADIASSHVAVGALVLVTTFSIAVQSIKLQSLRQTGDDPSIRPARSMVVSELSFAQ